MAADGTGSKKASALSSRLLQMKFMQKASEKAKLEAAQRRAQEQQVEEDASEPAGQARTSSNNQAAADSNADQQQAEAQPALQGCQIIYETAPLPAGLRAGRLSFGPKPVEAVQPEQVAMAVDEDAPASKAGPQGPGVSAVELGPQGPGEPAVGAVAGRQKQPAIRAVQPQAGMDMGDLEMALNLQPKGKQNKKKGNQKRSEPYTPYTSMRELKRAKK